MSESQTAIPEKSEEQSRRDRVALLFRKAAEAGLGSLVILEGVNLPGIKRVARRLSRVLDPRHCSVLRLARRGNFAGSLSPLHPYWVRLPAFGDLVVHEQSYYHSLADGMRRGKVSGKAAARQIADINKFESSLTDNGYVIIKIYFDRPRKLLRADYQSLGSNLRSIIKKRMRRILRKHEEYSSAYDELRGGTDTDRAHWYEPPSHAGRKALESNVLDHLIKVLEARLGIDSLAEVRTFDAAMDKIRQSKKKAGT